MKIHSIIYNGSNLERIKKMIKQPIKTTGFIDDPKGLTLEFMSHDGITKFVAPPGSILHFKGSKIQSVTKGQ